MVPSDRREGVEDDRSTSGVQTLRRQDRRRRCHVHGETRGGDRVPRPERRREVHHHPDDHGAGRADVRVGHGQRQGLRPAPGAAAGGGGAAGGRGRPHGTVGVPPPARASAHHRHPAAAGGRGARPGGAGRRRAPPGRRVLARHGAAARRGHRAARRSGHAGARRTRQRPRPAGHPLDPEPAAPPRGRGPHGVRVLAPDERDGADRGAPRRDRQGQAHRRHPGGTVETHVGRIFDKLELRDRVQAVVPACETGLVRPR
ncbi:two-component system response regulator [Amycolatopsis vancoresmycina DSM 44592]|uniref:Two-component system response regulator n=1 Tax=Amycolatopsis vancoresmycina DSM 44592 TaxID=1292037 RepID=R1G5D3_9PSEU|nr:two-component system response regulator [Amycolatopsis vancoresmycina DSM 44592]